MYVRLSKDEFYEWIEQQIKDASIDEIKKIYNSELKYLADPIDRVAAGNLINNRIKELESEE